MVFNMPKPLLTICALLAASHLLVHVAHGQKTMFSLYTIKAAKTFWQVEE